MRGRGAMDTLHVGHGHSKGSSRSQSPSAVDLRDPAVVTDDVIRSRVQSPSTAHHVSLQLHQNVKHTHRD